MASKTNFADNKDTYQAALLSLFSGKPEDTEAELSKLFSPTLSFRANEGTFDFAGFVKHIRWLRENVPGNGESITIEQFLRDGSQLAERHTSKSTHPDGTVVFAETFQFAKIADDGRVQEIIETVVRYPQKK